MLDKKKLSLLPTAIGSLPYDNSNEALELLFKQFEECPLWPQLSLVDKHEDMVTQYMQGLPGLEFDEKKCKFYFNTEKGSFFEELEAFYLDYDAIVNDNQLELLGKYAITKPYSSTIAPFLDLLSIKQPPFAKGQIIGPLTWGTSLADTSGKCVFYDETLKDIIVKMLTIKALWQINEIKKASKNTTPIIFMDEPAMSQYGTSALLTIERSDIINVISEISDVIKKSGALSAVHCCGKTDWSMIIQSGVNILNFDAFYFSKSLSLYPKDIEKFIKNGNYIAWGIIPTLDEKALDELDMDKSIEKFEKATQLLIKKGIDKNLLYEQSMITPSCGAGGLSKELAIKAMKLTSELSKEMQKKYLLETAEAI